MENEDSEYTPQFSIIHFQFCIRSFQERVNPSGVGERLLWRRLSK